MDNKAWLKTLMRYLFLSIFIAVLLCTGLSIGIEHHPEFVFIGMLSFIICAVSIMLLAAVLGLLDNYRLRKNYPAYLSAGDKTDPAYLAAVTEIATDRRFKRTRQVGMQIGLWLLGFWAVFLIAFYWAGYHARIGVVVKLLEYINTK